MRKLGKPVLVYLNRELEVWLDGKSRLGYKKASLIRHVLEKYMQAENNA